MKIGKFVSWTNEDSRLILVNSSTQKCIVLDDTGKLIWNKILDGYDKEEIIQQCILQFPESDNRVICRDVEDCISLLLENNIIQV